MSLFDYEARFQDLNPNNNAGHPSPHKVCLLLAVMDLVEEGRLQVNKVHFDEGLRKRFSQHFEKLRQGNDRDNPHLPYFHLRTQEFWHHRVRAEYRSEYDHMVLTQDARGPLVIQRIIEYAYLDDELFGYLQSADARQLLRAALGANLEASIRDRLLGGDGGWNWKECEVIVADYFDMLLAELKRERYSKAEHNRALQTQIERSRAAIERKHENISAVLKEMGVPSIDGYKPLRHYQKKFLPDVVNAFLLANHDLTHAIQNLNVDVDSAMSRIDDILSRVAEPPPKQAYVARLRTDEPSAIGPRKRDYVAENARNTKLGRLGEEFVLRFERARLESEGRSHLANRIDHVSLVDDTLGYDIKSYESNGTDRFIEVKTTSYTSRYTRFFVTPNELSRSQQYADRYHLCRVFNFKYDPRFFVATGDISQNFELNAALFEAKR